MAESQEAPLGQVSLPRLEYEASFTEHLAALDAGPVPPVMFYGVSGIGKTVLLRRLQGLCGDAYQAQLNLVRDMDRVEGLRKIAASLTSAGVTLRRYDRVGTILAAKEHRTDPPLRLEILIEQLNRRAELVESALELAGAVPLLGQVLRFGGKLIEAEFMGNSGFRRLVERLGGSSEFFRLAKLSEDELKTELIPAFADDLRELAGTRKIVLFFDMYESLWTGRAGIALTDEWLIKLWEHLRDTRTLLVFAGQEPLSEFWQVSSPYVVEGFSEADAREFLRLSLAQCVRRVGADVPPELVHTILDVCRVGDERFHCFSLQLCAGIIASAAEDRVYPSPRRIAELKGADVRALTRRLLESLGSKDAENLVRRLSVAFTLDDGLIDRMVEAFRCNLQGAELDRLEELRLLQRVDGRLALYRPIRVALRKTVSAEDARKVHEIAHAYWSAKNHQGAAWYHRHELDSTTAYRDLERLLDEATRSADVRLRDVLTWWRPIEHLVDAPRDRAEALDHCYYGKTLAAQIGPEKPAQLQRAIEHLTRAEEWFRLNGGETPDWAYVQEELGSAYLKRADGDVLAYSSTVSAHLERARKVWELVGDVARLALNDFHRGSLHLRRLESLNEQFRDQADAEAAVSAFRACLARLSPVKDRTDWLDAAFNLGEALGYLAGSDNTHESRRQYELVLRMVDRQRDPDLWARVQNSIGSSYLDEAGTIDDAGSEEDLQRVAITYFQSALETFTDTGVPEEWARVQYNLGLAHMRLGEEAEAIAAFRSAQTVWTRSAYPSDWQDCEDNISELLSADPAQDRQ